MPVPLILSLSALAFLATSSSWAHGGMVPPVTQRNAHPQLSRPPLLHDSNHFDDDFDLIKRQTSTSDPLCSNPPPAPFLQSISHLYPPPQGIAQLVSGDREGNQIYQQRVLGNSTYDQVLQLTPKGTPDGAGISSVQYDGTTDPDCWWTWGQCKNPKQPFLKPDLFACMEPETWGLSFDDGPNCAHDPFYDFLSQNGLKASLFYIGINVFNNPIAAQRGVSDGHQVCVHTWSHKYMTSLTNEQAFAELYYTKRLIKDVTGITPRCWRPPFGDVDDRIRTIALALDLDTVLWDHDTFDWEIDSGTPQSTVINNYNGIYQSANTSTGVGVLTHEISVTTMNLFMSQYPLAKQHFQHFMPMTTCYNISTPYAEGNITFPDFQTYISGDINSTNQEPFFSHTPLVFGVHDADDPASSSSSSSSSSAAPSSSTSGGTTTTNPGAGSGSGSGSNPAAASQEAGSGATSLKESITSVTALLTMLTLMMGLGVGRL